MNFETPKNKTEIIIKAAAVHFGYTVQEFTENPKSSHDLTYERFVCYYILKKETGLAYPAISSIFNKKTSGVRHGKESIEGLKDMKDRRTIADLDDIYLLINKFTSIKKFNENNSILS